jgi:hypothetical protein
MSMHLSSDCERYHRRDFLRVGAAGLLGLRLADWLRLEAQSAKAGGPERKADGVILVWLAGGPATIDMWDLKPDAPEGVRGEFKPIATAAPGVRICEHLPRLAKIMERCLLVRSVHHNIPEHGQGTIYLTTGNRPTPALEYPSLGSMTAKLLPARVGVPPYIAFRERGGAGAAAGAGYLGTPYSPFEVEGNPGEGRVPVKDLSLPDRFSVTELEDYDRLRKRLDARFAALDRSELSASLGKVQQQALDILRSNATRTAFALDQEPAALRDTYGRTALGQSALAARRLIEAGARFVTIGTGGWDTHAANFATLRFRLLPQLDQALAALITDLDTRGLLDRTVVYCTGEFNRTPRVNGTAGRDHWARSMAVLLAGGGFGRGCVYGSTDAQGEAPAREPCTPDDASATIFHCLGFEPQHELTTSAGRPIALFREGKVLRALLA